MWVRGKEDIIVKIKEMLKEEEKMRENIKKNAKINASKEICDNIFT